jgi:hypothetical protein
MSLTSRFTMPPLHSHRWGCTMSHLVVSCAEVGHLRHLRPVAETPGPPASSGESLIGASRVRGSPRRLQWRVQWFAQRPKPLHDASLAGRYGHMYQQVSKFTLFILADPQSSHRENLHTIFSNNILESTGGGTRGRRRALSQSRRLAHCSRRVLWPRGRPATSRA